MQRFLIPALLGTILNSDAQSAEPPTNYRFKVERLIEGMPKPMQLQFAPDGRIYFIEIAGKLKILDPKTKQVVEAGSLTVTNEQENGLIGMALDPQFATNHFIYLLNSPPDFNGQHLSRFEVKNDTLDMASEKVLMTYDEQRQQCCHHAGALRFGPDSNLFISSGDNTNPFESDGYSPQDTRPGRNPWDSQKSAANTNDLRGKLLRIKPTPDGKYTIPAGNLFPPGTAKTRPEIYAMGFRNPWRFSIDPKTGYVYLGDVGPDAGGDNESRGPRGFDTLNQVRKPGYFGWPYSRGKETYFAYNFAAKESGPQFDANKPINSSPNNTGLRELPPVQPPLIWYAHNESKEFPQLGTGGRAACGGPVFHFDNSFRETNGWPEYYDGCVIFYDWQRPFIKWVRLDESQDFAGLEEFPGIVNVAQGPNSEDCPIKVRRPVDMIFGPDGALYLMDYGETWGANPDSQILKISYQWGNLAPLAKASASKTSGREPLTIELSADGSKDLDGDALSYEWRLQPGDKIIATTASAKVTIPAPGSYHAELRVTDAKNATGTASVPLIVGNTEPVVSFVTPTDGQFFSADEPIKYQVAISDAEDGDSAAKADEFAIRTLVSTSWKTAQGTGAAVEPGLASMKASDCFNCHAIDKPLVGPPLLDISNKYRGQPGADVASVQRVSKGSTGIWGQVGMLPHPQHTEDEIHQMVQWIFSLKPDKTSPGVARGLVGESPIPKDTEVSACVLEASYTDAGSPQAGVLTGRATVTLRPRRIEAELSDDYQGPQSLNSGTASGKKVLGSIADKHTLKFSNLDLATTASVTCRASSGGVGGKIELRAGSPTGELLGEVDVQPTGGWDKWKEFSAPMKRPSTPRGDVYAVFVNPGQHGLMNLDWVQFNPR